MPHYPTDGYWRGPIRAPAIVLVGDGPRRSGHHRLADEISARFRVLRGRACTGRPAATSSWRKAHELRHTAGTTTQDAG